MPCYAPKDAWINRNNKKHIIFSIPISGEWDYVPLPCGKCIGCRKKQARDWTIRLCHEAELHEESCFLTLTYRPENMPDDGGLCRRDLQLFFKRLRKEVAPVKLRYFACGEYGENYSRPHYHVILFGLDITESSDYNILDLERCWGLGFVSSGHVTTSSAAYVAGYVQKKLDKREVDYVDETTGVIRQPEYIVMSRGRGSNKGIGYQWIMENYHDTYKDDSIILDNRPSKPPRYYDKAVRGVHGENCLEEQKNARIAAAQAAVDDATAERLVVRERIMRAQMALSKLKRGYEK